MVVDGLHGLHTPETVGKYTRENGGHNKEASPPRYAVCVDGVESKSMTHAHAVARTMPAWLRFVESRWSYLGEGLVSVIGCSLAAPVVVLVRRHLWVPQLTRHRWGPARGLERVLASRKATKNSAEQWKYGPSP